MRVIGFLPEHSSRFFLFREELSLPSAQGCEDTQTTCGSVGFYGPSDTVLQRCSLGQVLGGVLAPDAHIWELVLSQKDL